MNITDCHIRLGATASFESAVVAFANRGFQPVLRNARRTATSDLEGQGFDVPATLMGNDDVEVLVAADGSATIALRICDATYGRLASLGREVDILLMTESDISALRAIVRDTLGENLENHSWKTSRARTTLCEVCGEVSPNGRLLAAPVYRSAARSLYDDKLRMAVSVVAEAFGRLAVTRDTLEQLEAFESDPDLLTLLLSNKDCLTTHFGVRCLDCGGPQMDFEERREAELALAASSGKCSQCGSAKLAVVETLEVADVYLRGVQQGLWLESLASDVLTERTDLVWSGQMVGTKEIDVLGVLGDKIVLVECKDTSFGQTDLAMIGLKADEIRPDLIVVISTRDLHHNVKDDIEKMDKDIRVISEQSAEVIRAKLDELLCAVSAEHVRDFLLTRASNLGLGFPPWVLGSRLGTV
ncbi:MAG: hypothetical protein WEB04_06165 [Dehalococcoidia bacterium]